MTKPTSIRYEPRLSVRYPMNKTIAICVAIVIATLTNPIPASASKTPPAHHVYRGILPDAYYKGLAQCETGGNWQHSTRSYTGGLGIYRGTFKRWSNHSSAKNMTPRQQVKVADAIAFRGHTEPNGEFVYAVGVWGWGCVKGQKSLQRYICQSRHKLVQKWKRGC